MNYGAKLYYLENVYFTESIQEARKILSVFSQVMHSSLIEHMVLCWSNVTVRQLSNGNSVHTLNGPVHTTLVRLLLLVTI